MSSEYLAPLWDLSAKYVKDESTSEYRFSEYRATNDLEKQQSTIKVQVDDTASYMLYSKAMVEVNFTVEGTFDSDEGVSLPNGWLLFDNVRLQLNNKAIHSVSDPGILHHMTNALAVSKDYASSVSEQQLFYPIKKKDWQGLPVIPEIPVAVYGTAVANAALTVQAIVDHNRAAGFTEYSATAQAGNPTVLADGLKVFLPLHDHSAAIQTEWIKSGGAAAVWGPTGRVRCNADFDPYYASSVKRIMENNKKVSCWLPLCELFPILKNAFNRVQRGSRFELQFEKAKNIPAVFFSKVNVANLAFTFTKVSLWVPMLMPSLESEVFIESQISNIGKLEEPYEKLELREQTLEGSLGVVANHIRLLTQTARPLRVYIGLQKVAQRTDLLRNPVQFEALNLENLSIRLNSKYFPVQPYEVNDKNGLPRMLYDVQSINGKMFDYENGSVIDYDSFANGAHRIYCLDLTQMEQTAFVRANTMDLEVRYKLSLPVEEVPAGSAAGTPAAPVQYTLFAAVASEGVIESKMLTGTMAVVQA